jgi:DNA-binding beta-propeller fold protein YncE
MLPARPQIPRSSLAERPARPVARLRAGLGLAGLVFAAGCYIGDNALPPPEGNFYFPTGIVVSPGRTALYVTNADFDLQYNGGTVVRLDLARLRGKLSTLLGHLQCTTSLSAGTEACKDQQVASVLDACRTVKLGRNGESLLHPGPCSPFPLSRNQPDDLANVVSDGAARVTNSATIGAFASGAILVDRAATKKDATASHRLFVPVRGDPSITFFDVEDPASEKAISAECNQPGADKATCFPLACGAAADERCADDHRIGIEADRYANSRGLTLPVEPVGIAASEDGTALVVAHQSQKAVSLSINRGPAAGRPTVEFSLGNLADGPTEVATVPIPAFIKGELAKEGSTFGYQPGFLVSYRAAPQVDLFRYTDDAHAAPVRAFLTRVFQAAITVNADGKDSRGLVIDPSARKACEAACAPDAADCQRACLTIPLRIFMANRTPATLLIGKVDTTLIENTPAGGGPIETIGAFDKVTVDDSVPLAFGASKVALGHVITREGKLAVRVFISAFDSRLVFSYDPEARRVEAVIRTGRGPHALAFDTGDDSDPDGDGPLQGDGSGLHSYLFVGHFTDSYLGVVDLDMRHPDTFGTIFASVGTPTPPRESK